MRRRIEAHLVFAILATIAIILAASGGIFYSSCPEKFMAVCSPYFSSNGSAKQCLSSCIHYYAVFV